MKEIYVGEDGKQYETKEAAEKADKAYLKAQSDKELARTERKEAAKKVSDAYKAAAKAKKEANKEMQKFLDKYGHYSETFYGDDARDFFTDPFDLFFDSVNRFFH